jgi:hypothetical protein
MAVSRLLAAVCMVALVGALLAPSSAEARGEGVKDLFIGMGMGTAFGAAMGGATTLFLEPQRHQDKIFPLHYLVGAGIGFVIGTTTGAVVGWLPSSKEDLETVGENDVKKFTSSAAEPAWQMPLFAIQPVEVDEEKFEKGYFVYPVNISF